MVIYVSVFLFVFVVPNYPYHVVIYPISRTVPDLEIVAATILKRSGLVFQVHKSVRPKATPHEAKITDAETSQIEYSYFFPIQPTIV